VGVGEGEREGNHEGIWILASAAAALLLFGLVSGCGDFFDVDVDMAKQVFTVDFGNAQGTVPQVACDPASADSCTVGNGDAVAAILERVTTPNLAVSVAPRCDDGSKRCYAQASATVASSVAVLQDDDLSTKIARNGLFLVRSVDLAYTAPKNTLTFGVPAATLYVGPAGVAHPSDAGVTKVGNLVPLAAGAPLASERHLILDDDSAGRAVVEKSIRDKSPFVFLLVIAPRIDAGAPFPAGAVEVQLTPHVLVGL